MVQNARASKCCASVTKTSEAVTEKMSDQLQLLSNMLPCVR